MSTKLLNRRQARWSEFLSRFDFRITYRPGKAGGKPDALTRRSGDLPTEGDERLLANQHAVLKPQNLSDLHRDGRMDAVDSLQLLANDVPDARQLDAGQPDAGRMDVPGAERIDAGQPDAGQLDVPGAERIDAGQPDAGQLDVPGAEQIDVPDAGRISTLLAEAYLADPFPEWILGLVRNDARQCKEISLADCKERDGRLIYRDCIYVPDHVPLRLRLLQDHHDPPTVGHPGRAKTLELLAKRYYWPSMRKDVDRFVGNCHVCRRTKSTRHAP